MTNIVLPECWLYAARGFLSAGMDSVRVAILPTRDDFIFTHTMVATPSLEDENQAQYFRPIFSTRGYSVSHLSMKSNSSRTFLSIATDFYAIKVVDFVLGTTVHNFVYYGRNIKYNNYTDDMHNIICEDPVSCTEIDFCGDSLRLIGGTFSGTVLLWDSAQCSPLPSETLINDSHTYGMKSMIIGLKANDCCVTVASRKNVLLCDRRSKYSVVRSIADNSDFSTNGEHISCFDCSMDNNCQGKYAIGGDCGEILIKDGRKAGVSQSLNLQNKLIKAVGPITDVGIYGKEIVASTMYRGGFRTSLDMNTVENFFYDPFYCTSSIFSKSGFICIDG